MVTRKLKGLRRPPPDLIAKARDDTAAQVNRVFLTLVGTAAFCALSLFTPDILLLAGNDKINVPFAGPVSFLGFMLLGPAVLISLRIYLQFYVEHERRLNRIAGWILAARAPTLVPDRIPLMRAFIGFAFYLLLPLLMLAFAWKAAVFRYWGTALLVVVVAVVTMHLLLPLHRLSWGRRTILSMIAAILAGAVMMSFGPLLHRSFNLFRENLSDQWLVEVDLNGANLAFAKLSGANLSSANLSAATLIAANLSGANLSGAHLIDANLSNANLTGANLSGARLGGAILTAVDLSGANLTRATLSGANLSGATISERQGLDADLSDAILIGANLTGANLIGAKLVRANLTGANLTDARLTGADLDSAHLNGANLTGANLIFAKFIRANLTGANLTGASLGGTLLIGANLTGATIPPPLPPPPPTIPSPSSAQPSAGPP